MHPELFNLFGFNIQTYGFCLMVGFLTAVWFAMRRAARVKASPDVVLDVSFLALVFGVGGARLFYVVHYWQSQFADAANPLWAAIDIRKGGLEFLGGLLCSIAAIIAYLWIKKHPVRLYLDVLTPGAMWGLGIGRIGCFFNGCCYGAVCVAAGSADQPKYPWAISFPYGSPAQVRQWQERRISIPAELMGPTSSVLEPTLVSASELDMDVEKREGPQRLYEQLRAEYEAALAAKPNAPSANLKSRMESAKKLADAHAEKFRLLTAAQRYPSRTAPERHSSVSELQDLAAHCPSLPVHPVQLYATIGAILLSFLLSAVFYRRTRHGLVFGLMCVLYPFARVLEEIIRVDNPHDSAGLTVSQLISIGMFLFGVAYLYVIYKRMPERSPVEPEPYLPPQPA